MQQLLYQKVPQLQANKEALLNALSNMELIETLGQDVLEPTKEVRREMIQCLSSGRMPDPAKVGGDKFMTSLYDMLARYRVAAYMEDVSLQDWHLLLLGEFWLYITTPTKRAFSNDAS